MNIRYHLLTTFLLLVAALAQAQSQRIVGQVWTDFNADCAFNANDIPQPERVISARDSATSITYYGNTDSSGFFSISSLPVGTYIVQAHLPYDGLYYTYNCNSSSYTITLAPQQTDTANFPLQPRALSPLIRTDISSQRLRPCSQAHVLVSFDNAGANTAFNIQAEAELDIYMSYVSFQSYGGNFSVTTQNNRTLLITLDTLFPTSRRAVIDLLVDIDCTADTGQAHLSTLRLLTNDTLGVQPAFSGGNLRIIRDSCIGQDTVQFRITNPGAPTALPYIVTQDNIMLRQSSSNVGGGASQTVALPSVSRKTYRLEVRQPSSIPAILGDSIAWALAPACDANFRLNRFATWYYTGKSQPFEDADCHLNNTTFDDNFLTASPLGYDSLNYINNGHPIEYSVNLRNPNSTTQNAQIYCRLSPNLDPSTLEFYASSHEISWSLTGQDSLIINVLNIPANAEPIVNFRIRPKTNLPIGSGLSVITYADWGSGFIYVGEAIHSIADGYNDFIQVLAFEHAQLPNYQIFTYPNPAENWTRIQFDIPQLQGTTSLQLFDMLGHQIQQIDNNRMPFFDVQRGLLPAGTYIYQLRSHDGQLLGIGKIIFK